MSNNTEIQTIKWRDHEGNVYGVEKAVRNGQYVVIRTNPGGHRKAVKRFSMGTLAFTQAGLNKQAANYGWHTVK